MNQKSIQLLLASSFGLITTFAQAQVTVSFGPQVGYNLATTNYQYTLSADESYHVSSRSGLTLGIEAQASRGHLALQPALLYTQKGYGIARTTGASPSDQLLSQDKYRFNYLSLPINVVYTTGAAGQGFQVFGGPYVSALLGGHYQWHSELVGPNVHFTFDHEGKVVAGSEHISSSASEPDYASRRFDAGAQAGVGYRYRGMLVQVGYSLGLRNVGVSYPAGAGSTAPTYHNRAFQVSLAYLVGTKNS
jgi:hypothetical protein